MARKDGSGPNPGSLGRWRVPWVGKWPSSGAGSGWVRKLLIGLGALLVVLVVGIGVLVLYLRSRPLNTASGVATSYLQDWQGQHWALMQALVENPPADFVAVHTQMLNGLDASALVLSPGRVTTVGATARANFTAKVDVKARGSWTYSGGLGLVKQQRRWRVVWSPATVHPQLKAGQVFGLSQVWAPRAPILGYNGSVLQSSVPVETIGVEPALITNPQAVLNAFQQYLNIPAAAVNGVLHAPGVQPTWFLPVTQVPPGQFAGVQAKLAAVPGIVSQKASGRAPSIPGSATVVLGTTGPITAQRLSQLGPPYTSGSTVGLSGLEAALERQLAGTPTSTVQLQPAPVTGTASTAAAPTVDLFSFPGTPPQPVQTTLDPVVQAAGEAALARVTSTALPAALVAVDAPTGEIRAIVNRPTGGFDRALAGTYPPGSTFKIITTEGLLAKGMALNSPISCPPQVAVNGRTFKNFEAEAFGTIDLATAFAKSCNTAYVQMASTLTTAQFNKAASMFAFNVPEGLPLSTTLSSVPSPKDKTDQAGASIGQAEDIVSPLHMAGVAATVASGGWHPLLLVTGAGATTTATTTTAFPPLDPAVAQNLRTVMGLVVTQGTGTAAALPGTPVYGKTGTAEFGTGNPPPTHAWFVGFRGNLAFAVVVEGGGVGGAVAAPLAAKFLSGLPG